MRTILYTLLLRQYGVTYLDCLSRGNGVSTIYGYNKITNQYSFWNIASDLKLRLVEISESRSRALFSYKVLSRGI